MRRPRLFLTIYPPNPCYASFAMVRNTMAFHLTRLGPCCCGCCVDRTCTNVPLSLNSPTGLFGRHARVCCPTARCATLLLKRQLRGQVTGPLAVYGRTCGFDPPQCPAPSRGMFGDFCRSRALLRPQVRVRQISRLSAFWRRARPRPAQAPLRSPHRSSDSAARLHG